MLSRCAAATLLLAVSCGPAVDETDATNGSTTQDSSAGDRPSTGSLYGACEAVDMCAPLEFCVFPSDEGGYCSQACAASDDASGCARPPGPDLRTCLDIGLADGRTVCALDCSDDSCPWSMRCEAISTPSGDRRICF